MGTQKEQDYETNSKGTMYNAKEVRCVLLLLGAKSEFNVGQERQ